MSMTHTLPWGTRNFFNKEHSTCLLDLEGFHIHIAHRMAKCKAEQAALWARTSMNLPKVGGCVGGVWSTHYCGVYQYSPTIDKRQAILVYVAAWLILEKCRQGKQKWGEILHCWWWEQKMDLDVPDATGLDEKRPTMFSFLPPGNMAAGMFWYASSGSTATPLYAIGFLWGKKSGMR